MAYSTNTSFLTSLPSHKKYLDDEDVQRLLPLSSQTLWIYTWKLGYIKTKKREVNVLSLRSGFYRKSSPKTLPGFSLPAFCPCPKSGIWLLYLEMFCIKTNRNPLNVFALLCLPLKLNTKIACLEAASLCSNTLDIYSIPLKSGRTSKEQSNGLMFSLSSLVSEESPSQKHFQNPLCPHDVSVQNPR
jgi:hypothetical protein